MRLARVIAIIHMSWLSRACRQPAAATAAQESAPTGMEKTAQTAANATLPETQLEDEENGAGGGKADTG